MELPGETARFVCQMDVSSGGASLHAKLEMEQAKEDEYNAISSEKLNIMFSTEIFCFSPFLL